MNYVYKIDSFEVYDGDTVKAVVDLGFYTKWEGSIRVYGVDTPELRTSFALEKHAGTLVRDCVVRWFVDIGDAVDSLFFQSFEKPKFAGRAIGSVFFDDPNFDDTTQDLTNFLNCNGLAKPYTGGTREPWTDDQLHAVIAAAEKYLKNVV